MTDNTTLARAYHERTKHRLDGYARGPQYLDWDQQPNPFRRFQGTELLELPLLQAQEPVPASINQLATIGALLELSLGLSAWKQFGLDRWALRANPSSGNLHPTEGYVVACGLQGVADGVYHYAPHEHALELRGYWAEAITTPQLLLGLSSIVWREAWKYGERAFRYVQLDVGHALGAVRYAAAALGLRVELLPVSDAQISALLGLDREDDFADAEREHPDLLLRIQAGGENWYLPNVTDWFGRANALGGYPRPQWTVIDEVSQATELLQALPVQSRKPADIAPDQSLIPLIRQRRSAQAFSSKNSLLARDTFYQMLMAVMPEQALPWDVWTLPIRTHVVLFMHRVEGLPAGLYALPRHAQAKAQLQLVLNQEFLWQTPEGCPAALPLYHLISADARKAARTLSCHQDIASTSAFSLGMLTEYAAGLSENAAVYRHLFWEAGLLGQVLYLEAEKHAVRGTGIGCFFDDSVHQILGIPAGNTQFQSFYHFTVGSPTTDNRIDTLPPYSHLNSRVPHD